MAVLGSLTTADSEMMTGLFNVSLRKSVMT